MSFDLKIQNKDLKIINGQLKTVVDSEKLIQDILKICLTDAGSNILNPFYGSFISSAMIGSSLATEIVVSLGQAQIQKCLENLQSLQLVQVSTLQRVSPDEQLAAVNKVSIIRNTNDPRLFQVVIFGYTKGFKPITAAFRVSNLT